MDVLAYKTFFGTVYFLIKLFETTFVIKGIMNIKMDKKWQGKMEF